MTADWFMKLRTDRLSGLLISCRGKIEIRLYWTLLPPRRSSVNPPQVQAVLSQGPGLTEQINSACERRTPRFSSLWNADWRESGSTLSKQTRFS